MFKDSKMLIVSRKNTVSKTKTEKKEKEKKNRRLKGKEKTYTFVPACLPAMP
jgi:hypothetical protein